MKCTDIIMFVARYVDIHSHPGQVDDLVLLLAHHGVEHNVLVEDIKVAVDMAPMMVKGQMRRLVHTLALNT